MRNKPYPDATNFDTIYAPVVRLLILRVLVRCQGMAEFLGPHGFSNASLARFLGFGTAFLEDYTPRKAAAQLHRKLATAERKRTALPRDSVLARNVANLHDALGLSAVACDVLHVVVLSRNHPELHAAFEMAGHLTLAGLLTLLATCLGHPVADIKRELADEGTLARSALINVDRSLNFQFHNKVDLLENLADELCFEHEDLMRIFRSSIFRSAPSRLKLEDFVHLRKDADILEAYLRKTCASSSGGANVLIYGPPGTGKTEFVRALADAAALRLYEIPAEDSRGRPRPGKNRFDGYRFGQSLLASSQGSALLFDEIEDVFCDGRSREGEGNGSGLKGWVNRLLETNRVPTFWVTNHLGAIDPAHRRRFDFVLHLDAPPRSVRRRILDQHSEVLPLANRWLDEAAAHPALVPGVIERALRISAAVCASSPMLTAEAVVTRVMNNTLDALGVGRVQPAAASPVGKYRLDLLNADCDLEKLREGLRRVGDGRICLYGPPGTGKTAFGRHIADSLDRPLLVKRASEILSPYVGMAERNIAAMFDEAHKEGAVLLLDEADSLLRDRQRAQRSWEVTQVNEMLTQMESFRGIFIASTNLMDSLDAASMRRFDAKVRFGFLRPEQVCAMLETLCAELEFGHALDENWRQRTACLRQLAPGDFAAVARGARLNPPRTIGELVARLGNANPVTEALRDPIGFVRNPTMPADARHSPSSS